MVIWKFHLRITDRQTVMIPKDAEILSVQEQGDGLQMWAVVDPDADRETRTIAIIGTGNRMPDFDSEGVSTLHIDTVQTRGGMLVWHVFELL